MTLTLKVYCNLNLFVQKVYDKLYQNLKRLFFIALLPIVLYLFFVINFYNLPTYDDEKIYIKCGLEYVSGVPPYLCNFEHPPSAKYLIGFFSLFGLVRYLYMFLLVGSGFLVYFLLKRFGYGFAGALVFVLLVFDTLYFNTFRFLLLDPVAIFFSLLGVYLLVIGRVGFSAISMGLAVASKFSSVPVFLGSLYLVYRGRRFRGALVYSVIVLAVYLMTYVVDFSLGLDAIVRHHVDMYRYMSWRHGFSLPIALNGFLKLLTRTEFWRYSGDVFIVVSNTSGVYSVVNRTFVPVDRGYWVVGVGMGSILWYLFFPVLLYATYIVLTGRGAEDLRFFVLFSWVSLLNILAGSIDWYYANVLPYLYALLCAVLQRVLGSRFRYVAVVLGVVQAGIFFATVLGFIPFELVFIR